MNFAFAAAVFSWIAVATAIVFNLPFGQSQIVIFFFGLALLAILYGLANAATLRVNRITVKLPGLPASWRGRVAAPARCMLSCCMCISAWSCESQRVSACSVPTGNGGSRKRQLCWCVRVKRHPNTS